MKVEIVKEVKRSDGLWRFACGDVFDLLLILRRVWRPLVNGYEKVMAQYNALLGTYFGGSPFGTFVSKQAKWSYFRWVGHAIYHVCYVVRWSSISNSKAKSLIVMCQGEAILPIYSYIFDEDAIDINHKAWWHGTEYFRNMSMHIKLRYLWNIFIEWEI